MSDEKNTENGGADNPDSPPPEVERKRDYTHEPPEQLQRTHEAPEYRGHPPATDLELGHPPAEGVEFIQQAGEMHTGAEESPRPTTPPPKRDDAARSVRAPEARQESAPPAEGDDSTND
jgi:hypothetical protein